MTDDKRIDQLTNNFCPECYEQSVTILTVKGVKHFICLNPICHYTYTEKEKSYE